MKRVVTYLDCMGEPCVLTVTGRSVKITFQYKEVGMGNLVKAVESAIQSIGFSKVEEWTEHNRKVEVI